jgi:hypothetical protein
MLGAGLLLRLLKLLGPRLGTSITGVYGHEEIYNCQLWRVLRFGDWENGVVW